MKTVEHVVNRHKRGGNNQTVATAEYRSEAAAAISEHFTGVGRPGDGDRGQQRKWPNTFCLMLLKKKNIYCEINIFFYIYLYSKCRMF